MYEGVLCNFDVRPHATWKGPIDPDNPSSLYAHSHLIPNTRTFEFVRKPGRTEGAWFKNPKIGTINRNAADFTIPINIPVVPVNL